ncbi:hypothetical protein CCM_04079 [Cordyceps militaris CM01]|uniref:Uncharacterized protein n=1 Tax=Cordyceps militaris (strain CM01) TaxID=983644 RepID=G3JDN1_CORMM|nr:uncharacterized protein CCM_04079 [Cordyceps militaris CM01]EGX92706.1 hypothetical protein CCM_04079 [Cordyceps militaris CM01]
MACRLGTNGDRSRVGVSPARNQTSCPPKTLGSIYRLLANGSPSEASRHTYKLTR